MHGRPRVRGAHRAMANGTGILPAPFAAPCAVRCCRGAWPAVHRARTRPRPDHRVRWGSCRPPPRARWSRRDQPVTIRWPPGNPSTRPYTA